MMKLFDEEEIMRSYIRSERMEAAREAAREATEKATLEGAKETARKMIQKGKISLEEIAEYVPVLSLDDIKELEAEVMQMV